MFTDKLARYSNTLLVSLNNRISIRNAMANTHVTSSLSPAITFAVAVRSDSDTDMSCLPVEGERSPAAPKFQLSGDV